MHERLVYQSNQDELDSNQIEFGLAVHEQPCSFTTLIDVRSLEKL